MLEYLVLKIFLMLGVEKMLEYRDERNIWVQKIYLNQSKATKQDKMCVIN